MKEKFILYTNTFFIYSFIGYLAETFLKTFIFKNMNNGILYGPWIPVYGFGSVMIIVIMRFIFNRVKVKRIYKIILTVLISMLLVTIIELIGGIIIEKLFHKVFWNYDSFKYNIGHYISIEMTILWGAMSLFIIYVINPFVNKILKKIPNIFTYLVLVIFLIDNIVTCITKL